MNYPTTLNLDELVAELQKRDNEQKSINARLTSEIIEIKNRLDAFLTAEEYHYIMKQRQIKEK
jgi:hypothetical protein